MNVCISTSVSKLSTLVCTAAACGADVGEDGPLAECFVDVPGHDVGPEERGESARSRSYKGQDTDQTLT